MSELSWEDVIRNPAQYPDELLRRDVPEVAEQLISLRRAVVPRDTMTKEVEAWRQETAAAQRAKQELEQRLAYHLAGPAPTDPASTTPTFDYSSDPYLKPLAERSDRAYTIAEQNARLLAEIQKTQAQLAAGLAQIPVVMKLDQLRGRDAGLDTAGLLKFAQERRIGDLDDAYKLQTYETTLAQAREAGMQEGLERGKKEALVGATVPYAPFGGSPATMDVPAPQFDSLNDAENAALRDPEIISMFYQQS